MHRATADVYQSELPMVAACAAIRDASLGMAPRLLRSSPSGDADETGIFRKSLRQTWTQRGWLR